MDEALQEQLDPEALLAQHIERQLKSRGIRLSKARRAKIRGAIHEGIEVGRFSLDLSNREVACATLSESERKHGQLDLRVDADQLLLQVERAIPSIMGRAVEDVSELISNAALRDIRGGLRGARSQRKRFERRLQRRWGRCLELLELLRWMALEAASDLNDELKHRGDFLMFALVRLHARAIQTASEIEALLRTGHADGAHARWRTLHEITVVTMFLAKHGAETAERYIKHEAIESLRVARGYQERQAELGLDAISESELQELECHVEALVRKYGNRYRDEYGWAVSAINKEKPRFSDIEAAVELDYLRPYYKLASHNVHAGPKGALYRLGLMGDDMLLAGPSNVGLADPLVGAGNSMVQVSVTLLTTTPNVDRLVACRVLMKINRRLRDAVITSHRKLVADERSRRADGQ